MKTRRSRLRIQGRMQSLIPAVLMLLIPAVSEATPCLPGSLQSYINLGATGCTVDSTNFADFSLQLLDPFATLIPAGSISVTPINVGGVSLSFGVNQSAVSPQFFDALIGYSVTGASAAGARLTMSGASATGTGVVTAAAPTAESSVPKPWPPSC